jgi:hypothetical protein
MLIMFRKERIQLAGIEGAVSVELVSGDLQLGSAVIEVGHSERVGSRFMLVAGSEGGRERVGIPRWQLFV